MKEKIKELKELLEAQGSDGNWDYDPYMTGMYNGMELMVAILEDRAPQYRDTIKESPINRLVEALKDDEDYYMGWKANIAMAFVDNATEDMRKEYKNLHDIANKSAESFLKNLMS